MPLPCLDGLTPCSLPGLTCENTVDPTGKASDVPRDARNFRFYGYCLWIFKFHQLI